MEKISPEGLFGVGTPLPEHIHLNGRVAAVIATVERRGVAFFRRPKKRTKYNYNESVEQLLEICPLVGFDMFALESEDAYYVIDKKRIPEVL